MTSSFIVTAVYFAYGSNLLFARLHARCPSIKSQGTALLQGYRMTFDKPGGDGSGKCGIEQGTSDDVVIGVLYSISEEDIPILDRIEGVGHGYTNAEVVVNINNSKVNAFTYLPTDMSCRLPPYDWYKGFVLAGAIENNFPKDYLDQIAAIESVKDTDDKRRKTNLAIVPDHLGIEISKL
ncbi:MAG: gamma-glutamylcyclotransferase family protein [Pseudomonadota bacterium]